ncbi:MAG TPA: sigma-70 family RNA polymerase sigma factor [Tepidisphaeraceae bacterium]|nr:sigma-70 family RNA polymerase sigma factor [Tepidisphaeraceae bacterium]
MPDPVHTLTAAMAAGDPRAVEAFYVQYFDLMYRHACNITRRDEAFCLDVVQDAVLRVIRTVRAVDSEAQLASWLRLVTQTAAYDLLKAESRRKRRETVVALTAPATGGPAEDGPDEDPTGWLREQIASLDPQIARLIELRYEGGWTLTRIAEAVGLSVGTVDGRLRRALRELRSRVKRCDDE